jgi:antitoxin (DNA-binding transcriptional repressor) of toxin-antitoxin stability system
MVTTVSISQARSRLEALLEQVAAGEEIVITRRGNPVACLTFPPPPEQSLTPLRSLREFRDNMPSWRKPSTELLRELRDDTL